MKIPGSREARWRCVLADPDAGGRAIQLDEPGWQALADAGAGSLVQCHRTSWVQIVPWDAGIAYCKTYVYPTGRDRRRGWLRTTCLARSRARREAEALLWLRCHGFLAPRALAVAEARRFGVLHAAVILTEAVDASPLSRCLPTMPAPARADVLRALRVFVTDLHRAGFRDRNLDLRNILLAGDPSAPRFVKIDSPRYRLRRRGQAVDALAARDWQRLTASLAELELAWPDSGPASDVRS